MNATQQHEKGSRGRWRQPVIIGALGVALAACGGGTGDDAQDFGGSPTNPQQQPVLVPVDTDDTLGESLGERTGDQGSAPIVEAVAGARFVCARDLAGSAWCWGDQQGTPDGRPADPTLERGGWPLTPTRIQDVPPLDALGVPRWYTTASGGSALEDTACGRDLSGTWWCWGQHPEVDSAVRGQFTIAAPVEQPGALIRPDDLPAPLQGQVRAQLGILMDAAGGERRCGINAQQRLLCSPGVSVEDVLDVGARPTIRALVGSCALHEDGSVECGQPLDDGPRCALALTEVRGAATRGCGVRADGAWRCYGRPPGSGRIELPGLIDVDMSVDCRP